MPVRFISPSHYQAYGQYNGSPSDAQLSRYFYLNDFDHIQIKKRRRRINRIGFTLQLVTVRYLGTHLQDLTTIPDEVRMYVANQLNFSLSNEELTIYNHSETVWDHQILINLIYGYRSFHDTGASYQFLRWLYTRTWVGSERPSVLFDLSTAWLIEHKVLLPGVTVLERLVSQVRERAEHRSWKLINRQLNSQQKQQIPQLLSSIDEEVPIPFDELRQMPTHNSSPQIRSMLDRLEDLRSYQLHTTDVSALSSNRLKTLADYALTVSNTALKRLPQHRQQAILVAGMVTLAIRIQDLILDMVEQWFHESVTQAKHNFKQERLQSLAQFDQAAFQLRDFAHFVTELSDKKIITIDQLFTQFHREQIQASIATIDQIERPENNSYRGLIVRRYRSTRRFLPSFLRLISFESISEDNDVLNALTFLHQLDSNTDSSIQDAPRAVITPSWQSLILNTDGKIQRNAYTICVLQELLQQLRRRDIYVKPSERWHDPRQFLIEKSRWKQLKPQICRLLDRDPQPQIELKTLSQQLDEAYKQANKAIENDPDLRMEIINGIPRPIVTPLKAMPDTPELLLFQQSLTQRLPDVDLPDLMLEVHHMTHFADAFTHISEGQARITDLPTSICAILLAEGCNIGLASVVNENIPALTFERLRWVQQNYFRPDTLAEASHRLVQSQSQLRIAQLWGGGEVASADGLRFVVPQRALHGGFNRKYFGSGRGITFFNFMSNQFTGFHHIVIPGTLRDALFILDGLLDQNTSLQPTEVMTDTNSYTDVVFGLFWLLGFQFSPRLADIKDRRFWRMERQADYGVFNDISKHKISTKRVQSDWDDMLRTAGSLKTGTVRASQLMRIFSTSSGSSSLTKSIQDIGRIAKTLYMLHYLRDESYRRRILTKTNHTEFRHKLARRLCYGNRGELKRSYKKGQEEQLGALGLLLNLVVYWNTYYLNRALSELTLLHPEMSYVDLERITPLAYDHIRILGRYSFNLHHTVQAGKKRPLKPLPL
jgi:TnpA family transposase